MLLLKKPVSSSECTQVSTFKYCLAADADDRERTN